MMVLVLWRALFFEFTTKMFEKEQNKWKKCEIYSKSKCFKMKHKLHYMIPRSSHSNGRCVVLISPDHPYHHHHCYLHLHFLHHQLLHLPLQHIRWHYVPCIIKVLCALKNLISVKPFNINANEFKPIIK